MKSLLRNTLLAICSSFLIFGTASAALINGQSGTAADFNNKLSAAAGQTEYNTGNTPEDIMIIAIRILLSVLGMIFLIIIYIAGSDWMQSNGNEEKIQKAKDSIRNMLIGLALILLAYALSAGFGGILSSVLFTK